MKNDPNRKNYWDQKYYEYWKARVDESSSTNHVSDVLKGDAVTEGDQIYKNIFNLYPFKPGKLLEIGCAWGRMFNTYKSFGLNIYGIDISKVMVDQATKNFLNDSQVQKIQESEAESIPFDNNFFENVSCLATFDATFQEESLKEMIRVLKRGGYLYLTGKNSSYCSDDQLALEAEIGAREKGHPNFFTDTQEMIDQIIHQGHKIISSYFFPRRGDFGKENFTTNIPDNFYEWFLIIQKESDSGKFKEFSNQYSQTFQKIYK